MERHDGNHARALIILSLVAAPVVAALWAVHRLTERTIAAIDRNYGDDFWLALALFWLLVIGFTAAGGAIALVRRWNRHVRAKDGLFPILETRRGLVNANEPGAQTLAALAGTSRRVSAPTAARVIDAHYNSQQRPPQAPAIELVEPTQAPITVRDVVASINPRISPHWLLIGTTGSGKTSASYSILSELGRRAPCRFLITEPGGVNWGQQAIATRTPEIAEVIIQTQQEMERRQDMLRQWDVDHIEDLPEPPGYIVLVAEEMDAVLDELKLTDLKRRTETLVALRAIARMGRKPGVCLVAVSQSGTTDVFDSHVRKNMGNVLLFRSEHTVNEMWRLQGVKLSELSAGMAYSVQHGSTVQFPHVQRPLLAAPQPPQPLYDEGPIWVNNWPHAATVEPVVQSGEAVAQRLERGRNPDAQLAATMRQWHADGVSKTTICDRVWGYKDGPTWQILDRVLTGEI